jgi:hypothetical protein
MEKYNKEALHEGRRELGLLLHIEEGRIFDANSGIDASIEFRTRGLVIFSIRNDAADLIPFDHIHSVSIENGVGLEGVGDIPVIMLILRRKTEEEKIYLLLENPDFLAQGLEKALQSFQKEAVSKRQKAGYGDILRDLNKLRLEGLISEEEYLAKKDAILKRMVEE